MDKDSGAVHDRPAPRGRSWTSKLRGMIGRRKPRTYIDGASQRVDSTRAAVGLSERRTQHDGPSPASEGVHDPGTLNRPQQQHEVTSASPPPIMSAKLLPRAQSPAAQDIGLRSSKESVDASSDDINQQDLKHSAQPSLRESNLLLAIQSSSTDMMAPANAPADGTAVRYRPSKPSAQKREPSRTSRDNTPVTDWHSNLKFSMDQEDSFMQDKSVSSILEIRASPNCSVSTKPSSAARNRPSSKSPTATVHQADTSPTAPHGIDRHIEVRPGLNANTKDCRYHGLESGDWALRQRSSTPTSEGSGHSGNSEESRRARTPLTVSDSSLDDLAAPSLLDESPSWKRTSRLDGTHDDPRHSTRQRSDPTLLLAQRQPLGVAAPSRTDQAVISDSVRPRPQLLQQCQPKQPQTDHECDDSDGPATVRPASYTKLKTRFKQESVGKSDTSTSTKQRRQLPATSHNNQATLSSRSQTRPERQVESLQGLSTKERLRRNAERRERLSMQAQREAKERATLRLGRMRRAETQRQEVLDSERRRAGQQFEHVRRVSRDQRAAQAHLAATARHDLLRKEHDLSTKRRVESDHRKHQVTHRRSTSTAAYSGPPTSTVNPNKGLSTRADRPSRAGIATSNEKDHAAVVSQSPSSRDTAGASSRPSRKQRRDRSAASKMRKASLVESVTPSSPLWQASGYRDVEDEPTQPTRNKLLTKQLGEPSIDSQSQRGRKLPASAASAAPRTESSAADHQDVPHVADKKDDRRLTDGNEDVSSQTDTPTVQQSQQDTSQADETRDRLHALKRALTASIRRAATDCDSVGGPGVVKSRPSVVDSPPLQQLDDGQQDAATEAGIIEVAQTTLLDRGSAFLRQRSRKQRPMQHEVSTPGLGMCETEDCGPVIESATERSTVSSSLRVSKQVEATADTSSNAGRPHDTTTLDLSQLDRTQMHNISIMGNAVSDVSFVTPGNQFSPDRTALIVNRRRAGASTGGLASDAKRKDELRLRAKQKVEAIRRQMELKHRHRLATPASNTDSLV